MSTEPRALAAIDQAMADTRAKVDGVLKDITAERESGAPDHQIMTDHMVKLHRDATIWSRSNLCVMVAYLLVRLSETEAGVAR